MEIRDNVFLSALLFHLARVISLYMDIFPFPLDYTALDFINIPLNPVWPFDPFTLYFITFMIRNVSYGLEIQINSVVLLIEYVLWIVSIVLWMYDIRFKENYELDPRIFISGLFFWFFGILVNEAIFIVQQTFNDMFNAVSNRSSIPSSYIDIITDNAVITTRFVFKELLFLGKFLLATSIVFIFVLYVIKKQKVNSNS